jgi:hypothetical protein
MHSLSASPGSGGREGSGTGILKSVMCRTYRCWSVRDRQNVRYGLMVPGMTESLSRYDVTVTIARDGGYLPGPPEFALAAEQAALSRNASVVAAYTAEQIISVVTVGMADRPAAVAVALAVVSEALRTRFRMTPPVSRHRNGAAFQPPHVRSRASLSRKRLPISLSSAPGRSRHRRVRNRCRDPDAARSPARSSPRGNRRSSHRRCR